MAKVRQGNAAAALTLLAAGCGLTGYDSIAADDASAAGDGSVMVSAHDAGGRVDADRPDVAGGDGGLDAGGGATGTTMDAGRDSGTQCEPMGARCVGQNHLVCNSAGTAESSTDCAALSTPCSPRTCALSGCIAMPLAEGAACGQGLTCTGGVCGGMQVCAVGQSCTYTCADASSCGYDCNGAATCTLDCRGGSTCSLTCDGTGTCRPRCREDAVCVLDCRNAIDCELRCDAGATCIFQCDGATNCDQVRCHGDAACLLECGGSGSCAYLQCEGGQSTCPNNVIACNRACP